MTRKNKSLSTEVYFGSDTGGTFTDIVVVSPEKVSFSKVPSNKRDPSSPVISVWEKLLPKKTGGVHFSHGTTVGTNALLERTCHPTAVVTTAGFADILILGRQNRKVLYSLNQPPIASLVPPDFIFEVHERVNAQGKILQPVSVSEIQELSKRIQDSGCTSVAVSFLFSFLNPENEQICSKILSSEGFVVTTSHEVAPSRGEYERTCATVINGMLLPVISSYTSNLEQKLSTKTFFVTGSKGNSIAASQAASRAIETVLSGPAAGVSAASDIGKLTGETDIVTIDMGGTSTDVSIISQGKPCLVNSGSIDNTPLGIWTIDIETVGAGGGSVARIDDGGLLKTGPESAGSWPGPACYNRGGTNPTVTDAQVVLKKITQQLFTNESVSVDEKAAQRAIEPLAHRLGKTVSQAAADIIRVTESSMERALRKITLSKGYDPRHFSLMCFGGAAPLHCCSLLKSLSMTKGIIPPWPGALCALGTITSPLVRELRFPLHLNCGINGEFIPISKIQDAVYAAEKGCQGAAIPFLRIAFKGQTEGLILPWYESRKQEIFEDFSAAHERQLGFLHRDSTVEILELIVQDYTPPRCTMKDLLIKANADRVTSKNRESRAMDIIDVCYDGIANTSTKVFLRENLSTDSVIEGPAIVIDPTSTILIEEGFSGTVHWTGSIFIEKKPFTETTKTTKGQNFHKGGMA